MHARTHIMRRLPKLLGCFWKKNPIFVRLLCQKKLQHGIAYSFIWDMTHSYGTWLIHMGRDSFIWDMIHSYGIWYGIAMLKTGVSCGNDVLGLLNCTSLFKKNPMFVGLFCKNNSDVSGSLLRGYRVAMRITHEWVMSGVSESCGNNNYHAWMSHVTCGTNYHIWMSYVTCSNESCPM